MYRAGRKSQPKLPSTPAEFATALETAEHHNMNLREVVTDDDGEMALIFFTNMVFTLVSTMKHLAFDGTFFVVPKLFKQLFTIHTVIMDHSFPMIYVLMTAKSEQLYSCVSSAIKAMVPELVPESLMGDFELAARNAMHSAFPEALLGGCQFHFSQALWKKIQKLNLVQSYKQNPAIKKHVKMLFSLPYLPADSIRQVAATLFSNQLDGLTPNEKVSFRKFHSYIQRFWLDTITPERLSVFQLSRGTNNDCESFHSRLKSKIKTHRPNIWSFLGHLNNFMEDVQLDIERMNNGLQISRRRARSSVKNVERRDQLKQKLSNDQITAMTYLAAIAHTFDNCAFVSSQANPSDEESEESDQEEQDHLDHAARNRCPVCLQGREETYVLVPCFHAFCQSCSSRFPSGTPCPVCRTINTGRQQIYL